MAGVPSDHILIDLDCDVLDMPEGGMRGDYVFVGAESDSAWVAVIELTSGPVRGSADTKKLQAGADRVCAWLPRGEPFRFIPLLVHGGGNPKYRRGKLRSAKITTIKFCGREWQPIRIRCRGHLVEALADATDPSVAC